MNFFSNSSDSLAKFLTSSTEKAVKGRQEAFKSGEFVEKGRVGRTIHNIKGQIKASIDKVYKSEDSVKSKDSIIKDRAKAISENWNQNSYLQAIIQPVGALYDFAADRWLLEDVPNTMADTSHTITSFIPYTFSVITGRKTESNFNSRNYSVTTGYDGNIYRDNRLEQFATGARDIFRGLIYGNSNDEKGVKTGALGALANMNVFEYGVSQSFRNLHDGLYGSAARTFSGFKNTLSPAIISPVTATLWALEKGKDKASQLSFSSSSSSTSLPKTNFNFSNYSNLRDEDGEIKSRSARFKSIFQSNQNPPSATT